VKGERFRAEGREREKLRSWEAGRVKAGSSRLKAQSSKERLRARGVGI